MTVKDYYQDIAEVLPFVGNFETAYVAENYPYGSVKTQMKFWVEYSPKMGFRAVTCSLNPKTGLWNKPHAGVYSLAIAIYKNYKGHFKFAYFSKYNKNDAAWFFETFSAGLSQEGKERVKYFEFVVKNTRIRNILDFAVFAEVVNKTNKDMKAFFEK